MEFSPQELQESHMGSASIALSSGTILDWHMEFAIFSSCCSIEVFELDPEYASSPAPALIQECIKPFLYPLLFLIPVNA